MINICICSLWPFLFLNCIPKASLHNATCPAPGLHRGEAWGLRGEKLEPSLRLVGKCPLYPVNSFQVWAPKSRHGDGKYRNKDHFGFKPTMWPQQQQGSYLDPHLTLHSERVGNMTHFHKPQHLAWLSWRHLAFDPDLPLQPPLSSFLESPKHIYFHFSNILMFLCLLRIQLVVYNPSAQAWVF